MTVFSPVCVNCKHYDVFDNDKWSCKAFPKGIPDIIIFGENDHTMPLKDQKNDIVFEPIEK